MLIDKIPVLREIRQIKNDMTEKTQGTIESLKNGGGEVLARAMASNKEVATAK